MKIQAITIYPVRNFLRFNQRLKSNVFLNQGFDTFSFSGRHKSKEEIEQEIQKIRETLLKTIEEGKKISLEEMSKQTGIPDSTIGSRIHANDELLLLWNSVKKRDMRPLSEHNEIIKKALIDTLNKGEKITKEELSQMLGIPESTIEKRIYESSDLKELYNKVKHIHHSKEEMAAKLQAIKDFLLEKMENNETPTKKEVANHAGLAPVTLNRILQKHKEIADLWTQFEVPQYHQYTDKENEAINNYMHRYFLQQREKDQKITYDDVAEYFNLSRSTVIRRINENPSLLYQWKKVRAHSCPRYDEMEIEGQIEKIKEILKCYQLKGMKITMPQMCKISGLSRGVIIDRIEANPSLKKLWNETKMFHPTYSQKEVDKQYKKIEEILLNALINNEKTSLSKIAKSLNISSTLVLSRINSDKKLKNMWRQLLEN